MAYFQGWLLWLAAALVLLPTGLAGCLGSQEGTTLVLATTTSTYDSGLLDYLLPFFEAGHNVNFKVVAVGTGLALEMGRRGDADVLLVHAPAAEQEFMAQGYGLERREVMYNQFLVAGPPTDPANISGAENLTQAFVRLFTAQEPFASRGDDSGTHKKEIQIWTTAGYDYATRLDTPQTKEWYYQTGQSMGATLTFANEKSAYLLVDEATWYRRAEGLDYLMPLYQGDPQLFNQYGVIAVNSSARPTANLEPALDFVEWLTSPEGQSRIGNFTAGGRQLFTPNYAEVN